VAVTDAETDGNDGSSNVYAVTLDGKMVKTPMRTPLKLPNQSLAIAIASEWDAQVDRIKPALMPIMTLASTALDLDKASSKVELVNEMLHYLHSDTLCYQVTADQMEKLAVLQQKKWDPIRKWFVGQFEGELDVAHGSIGRLTHDESIVAGIREELSKVSSTPSE
jgi:ATP synthase F1 complex assembly factor 2